MELILISCNIRFDNPADGQNSWVHRRDFLTQTLLQYTPAFISTQEGRFHQLKELETLLKDFEIIDQHRSWIGERMYPTMFMKRGLFEYLASGDLWLSETPDVAGSRSFESAFPRLMTWAKIQVKGTHQNLFMVNTHLDHVKAETRSSQIKVLADGIKRLWDKQSPLVIMGDFNDSPDSKVREILIQEFPFLQDAWRMFNQIEESSHHAFKGEMQNGSRIDWILVDNKLSTKNCQMDKSVNHGSYPTDHYPIVCEIKF
ncbi:MAG: endonuclease/exonuclease/phosphatase family protein [Bdellovibrionales bacterium]|nr:endonuclease/exonuclease/phosphatase family protein [Bdellovibrionales bacterium]